MSAPGGGEPDEGSRAAARAGVIFASGGRLARSRQNFEYRAGQRYMAEAVARAFEEREHLVVEAETGTGKTLAYVVPSLELSEPVILSTGTKALQNQLVEREMPVAARATGSRKRVVILKGRANYLCLKKLHEGEGTMLLDAADEIPLLGQIREWAGGTETGDRAEVEGLPDASPLWGKLDGRGDTCTGAECEWFDDCFVYRARKAAERAHVVVVNHHLLFAELALRDGGFGRILPDAPFLVIDEAHLADDIASSHFGHRISARMVADLAHDAAVELEKTARDAGAARTVERAAARYFELARPAAPERSRGGRSPAGGGRQRFEPRALGEAGERCADALAAALDHLASEAGGEGDRASERALIATRATALRETLTELIDVPRAERVVTVEPQGRRGATIASWPIEVGPLLERAIERSFDSVVATSATLAIGGRLTRSSRKLGLPEARGKIVRSPFRLSESAALFVPRRFPEPRSPEFGDRALDTIEELLEVTDGRALVLFASHRALDQAARRLRDSVRWRVLVQGDAPREQLIESFRDDERSVLLGTASFRQGIDVPGPSLSLVVVDKLPFAVPDDPLVAARGEAMRRRGEDPFLEDSLPEAILALRQALGRLIRTKKDRGLLALLDVRVRTKRYGKAVLDSLPEWPLVGDVEEARRWFRREPEPPPGESPPPPDRRKGGHASN